MSYSARSTGFTTLFGTTLGSGDQTIDIFLGQDRYAEDVQFTVSVDGTPVGGVQTVTAIQADGQQEQFTIRGDWTGNPTVSVDFLNDGWNGSTGLGNDRNLYIDGVRHNGTLVSDVIRQAQWSGPTYLSTERVTRTEDFIGRLGVTTHLLYLDTSYRNEDAVLSALGYLGIDQVRDGGGMLDPDAVLPFQRAMKAGIQFNFTSSTDGGVATEIARLRTLVAFDPGGVVSIEGINEADPSFRYAGLTGQGAALQFQRELYQAVKADPLLSAIPVLNYTLLSYDSADYTAVGDVSATADYGNVHLYNYGGMALPTRTLLPRMLQGTPGSKGFVVSETGYDTMSNGNSISAKYTLDDLFDLAAAGASMTYLYELLDDFDDPGLTNVQNHFGLFHADGTPKPVATAIHNLTSLLADTGAAARSFTPGFLAYAVSGLPETGQTMLLAKSDGSFDLVVWAEPLIRASPDNSQEVAAPHQAVTVTLDAAAASIDVFDPLLGTAAIASHAGAAQVTLDITDHPLILAIRPQAAASQAVPALAPIEGGGWLDGVDRQFDRGFYLSQNPDVAAAGMDPLVHYEAYGWREGRDPSLLFSTRSYLEANPDVAAAGVNPLEHYLNHGQAEGRATFPAGPSAAADPLVDAAFYDAQLGATLVPAGLAGQQQAAGGYAASGWQRGLDPNAWFDTDYYLSSNPDVAAAHVNPLLHYETYGWHEGRDPSAAFSTTAYLAHNPGVAAANVNPLLDFFANGVANGREAYPV